MARGLAAAAERVGLESAMLQGLASHSHHLVGETYFTQCVLRYGDHIAKLSVAPVSDNARALTGVDMPDLSQSGIERAVAKAVRDQPVSFDLRVR